MNKCVLVGNLAHDPELSQTSSGIAVCKFTVAVNRNYTNASGEREADFIPVVVWRSLAESCGKYLNKGSKVAVSGSLQTSSYENGNGERRYRTDLVAESVGFLNAGNKEAAEPKGEAQTARKKKLSDLQPTYDDGLPF